MSIVEQNQQALGVLKKLMAENPTPTHQYKPVIEGAIYETTKNRITTKVYVDRVKKDQVILKRDKGAKDSSTISRAKFQAFYHLDQLPEGWVPSADICAAMEGIMKFATTLAEIKKRVSESSNV
jgi:hypothetical protein